jgi:hypothetical protein
MEKYSNGVNRFWARYRDTVMTTEGHIDVRQLFHIACYVQNETHAIRLFIVWLHLPLFIFEMECFSRGHADIL